MYPYLWIRIRKYFKGAWNRYFSSKRERTTSFSSLQQCLDHQQANRGSLWKNWFLLLLIAPSVYYVTFLWTLWQEELTSNTAPKPVPKQILKSTTEKISTPWSYEKSSIYNKTRQRSLKNKFKGEVAGNPSPNEASSTNLNDFGTYSEFYKYTGGTPPPTVVSNNATIPWCRYRIKKSKAQVKFQNVSHAQWYRQLVKKGGYFSPTFCKPRHKVAIIVPYRDRQINLAVFLFTIHPFLIDQMLEYRIFVIEQYGKELFNKGRLFNAGYLEAVKLARWDCLVFHDVDLLPMSKLIMYSCPIWPRHMCPTLVEQGKNMWNFHTYFGGVASMTTKHFVSLNGFSNLYWGWGGEDTDIFWRIKGAGLPMARYQKDVARYLTLPHERIPECKNKNELIKTAIGRYPYDGLSTLKYKVVSMKLLHLYTHILADINPPPDNVTTV